jgi:predicted small metal-binding protein
MKTMTCAQIGGMCDEKLSGATPDELIANGMKHLEEKHPEMAESIKTMSPEDPMLLEWKQKFDAEWAAAPEE